MRLLNRSYSIEEALGHNEETLALARECRCGLCTSYLETYDTKKMSVIVPEEIVKQLICE